MDFTNNAFQSRPTTTFSDDTMSHTKLVQACRFDWAAGPQDGASLLASPAQAPAPVRIPLTTSNDSRVKRLSPCRGRLYHQLICSHRIRTDYVDDCGSNCLEPFGTATESAFYCQECIDNEAAKVREVREADHNAMYPSMDQMTKEQYETWYGERSRLEAQFARDRKIYLSEMKMKTRPSNICSALEMSKEEVDYAAELDSLSVMVSSIDSPTNHTQSPHRQRVSLPNDASEQLHWGLKSLAIDRGSSCGVEYTSGPPTNDMRPMSEEELWNRLQGKN